MGVSGHSGCRNLRFVFVAEFGMNLENAVLLLIQNFIERQYLVRDVLHDLRPDMFELMKLPKDPTREQFEEYVAFAEPYQDFAFRGLWGENNAWQYFIHGQGCRLTHTQTGEIIEWDIGESGDITCFDGNWFVNHVAWLLEHDQSSAIYCEVSGCFSDFDGNIEQLREVILLVLVTLRDKGILSRDGGKYTLADHS